jgi:hypothetical protein
MKLLYLCIMENTMNNNIHQNQILPLVKDQDTIVLFIAPLFILNKQGFKINCQKFHQENIYHIRIPLLSYNFLMNFILIPIFILLSLPIVLNFIHKYKIDTIHSRNHLSSLIAVLSKLFFKHLNVLSDLRGLYAEEGAILRRWKYNSLNFKLWKKIEKYICQKSNIVTSISNNMKEYLRQKYSLKNIYFVPAIVDIKQFYFSEEHRNRFREKYKISTSEIVFIYVGSIGVWHDVKSFYIYIEKYIKLNSIKKYKVFILSNIKREAYQSLHDKYNTIILQVKPHEVNDFLCGADIGILPGTKKIGHEYDLLYKTMISSKLEEYLCVGLKVIINKRIEEAVKLVALQDKENIVFDNRVRNTICKYYAKQFSSVTIKEKYLKLYNIKNIK